MQELRQSQSIMVQMLVVALLLTGLAVYFSDTLAMVYLSNQQTSAGYALNGLIVVLFALALGRVLVLLYEYNREEKALNRVQRNMGFGSDILLDEVDPASIIAVRIATMAGMRLKHVPIPQHAMASALLATESTRTALVRFIHNILILCGVLGTIISLSIALFGASNMLEQAVSSTGMGLVIHGMSTALSTTMSAIVCYLVLAYFLTAIQNLQTRFLGRLEEITATHLLPLYQITEAAISQHSVDLVAEAHVLMQAINEKINQLDLSALKEEMQQGRLQSQQLYADAKEQSQQQHEESKAQFRELAAILKDGFRLPGQ